MLEFNAERILLELSLKELTYKILQCKKILEIFSLHIFLCTEKLLRYNQFRYYIKFFHKIRLLLKT